MQKIRNLISIIGVFSLALIGFSCKHTMKQPNHRLQLPTYQNTTFYIENTDYGYIVTTKNPWNPTKNYQRCILYRNTKPAGTQADAYIKIPVKKVVTLSTTHVGFIAALNQSTTIRGLCEPLKYYNTAVKQRFISGEISDLGPMMNANIESILALTPDVIFESGFETAKDQNKTIASSGIPVVYTLEWKEENPVSRAEWIRFFALFYDEEQLGDSLFNAITKRYTVLRDSVQYQKHKPTVIAGNSFKGIWYLPGGKSFISNLIADAGGNYVYASDTTTGSVPVGFEIFYNLAQKCDFWLNVEENKTEEMAKNDSRLMTLNLVKDGHVYNRNKRNTPEGGMDYWESAVVAPDELLADFITIFHPGFLAKRELMFYKPLE